MISITKLLLNREHFGDSLRYTPKSRKAKNGTSPGIGPVVVWNSTKTCNLRCVHCYMGNGNFRTRAEAVTGDFWESDPACYLTDEEIGLI